MEWRDAHAGFVSNGSEAAGASGSVDDEGERDVDEVQEEGLK